jgi:hypothetical protein
LVFKDHKLQRQRIEKCQDHTDLKAIQHMSQWFSRSKKDKSQSDLRETQDSSSYQDTEIDLSVLP